jgi:excisionase family DNA binding protein
MARYWTLMETAERLGLSRTAVYTAARDGRIPTVRLPGIRALRVDPDALERRLVRSDDQVVERP